MTFRLTTLLVLLAVSAFAQQGVGTRAAMQSGYTLYLTNTILWGL
jgi:hypothetical protein